MLKRLPGHRTHADSEGGLATVCAGIVPLLGFLAVGACLVVPRPAAAQSSRILPDPVPVEAVSDSLVRVDDHPDDGHVEIVIGPVHLRPNLPHYRAPIQTMTWPRDGWMKGYDWTLVDGRGDTLPNGMLHHLGIMDPGRRQLFSPIAQRLVAAGAETEAVELPPGFGVPVSGGTTLLVVGMFANPTDEPVEEAYLHIDVRYVSEEGSLLPRLSVRPFYLDVMGPLGNKSFAVPPGRTVKSWEGSPAVNARILGISGHAHDHARQLTLVDVTTGDTVWSVQPKLDEEGQALDVPEATFVLEAGRKVEADHTYRTTVVYDNPTAEPASHGGMGVIAGVAWTDEDDWPPFDDRDTVYLADLWNTVTAPIRAGLREGGHGHGPLSGTAPGGVQDTAEWNARLARDGDAWPEAILGRAAPWAPADTTAPSASATGGTSGDRGG